MTQLPKRPHSHQIASESTSHIRENLPREWNVLEFPAQNDYGVDFFVEVFEDEFPTGTDFFVQCKSASRRNRSVSDKITHLWPVANVLYLLSKKLRSLLVLYVAEVRTAYWLWVNQSLTAELDNERPDWRKQEMVSLRFPTENVLSSSIIKDAVASESYPRQLSDDQKLGVDETVFSLCAFYKDVIAVLCDMAENRDKREFSDYTSRIEEVNELLAKGVLCIALSEIRGYYGFEHWALRPELTVKGLKVLNFVHAHRNLVQDLVWRTREAWATAG